MFLNRGNSYAKISIDQLACTQDKLPLLSSLVLLAKLSDSHANGLPMMSLAVYHYRKAVIAELHEKAPVLAKGIEQAMESF